MLVLMILYLKSQTAQDSWSVHFMLVLMILYLKSQTAQDS